MNILNVANPTGVRGKWLVSLGDNTILKKNISGWTRAVQAAKDLANEHNVDTVLLHKINGSIQPFPISGRRVSKNKMLTVIPEDLDQDFVYIARVEYNVDNDSKRDKNRQCATLEDAVKALPRAAQELNWTSVDITKFTSYVLNDGRIVSIERTTY